MKIESSDLGDSRSVADTLSQVALILESAPDLEATLGGIVTTAAGTVPGVDECGVSLLRNRHLETVAATSDVVREIDAVQNRLGEGPCVDAVDENTTYRCADLAADERWPSFGPEAAALGMRSAMGFRLSTLEGTLGSLNLYASKPDAFDDDAQHIGELFARHAAVALTDARTQEQLQTALKTRDAIAMAKGMLIERHGITPDQAFDMLVRTSQRANIKLHEIARWLVEQRTAADQGKR